MCLRTVTNSIYVHIQNIPHPHIRPYSILSVSILISIHWYDITFYMHEFMLYYFVESNTMRDFAYIWRWFGKNSLWIPFVCSRRSGDDLSSIHNFHDTMRLKWFLAKQCGSTEKPIGIVVGCSRREYGRAETVAEASMRSSYRSSRSRRQSPELSYFIRQSNFHSAAIQGYANGPSVY